MKVARELGWFNVDAMLASGEAGQLDEWLAYEKLEPSGDDWERTSLLLSQLLNAIQGIAAGFGGGQAEPIEWDHFVKFRSLEREKQERRKAIAALPAEGL